MNAPDKAKEIRGVVAAAIGFLTALWGWIGWAVIIWAAAIVLDYLSRRARSSLSSSLRCVTSPFK